MCWLRAFAGTEEGGAEIPLVMMNGVAPLEKHLMVKEKQKGFDSVGVGQRVSFVSSATVGASLFPGASSLCFFVDVFLC